MWAAVVHKVGRGSKLLSGGIFGKKVGLYMEWEMSACSGMQIAGEGGVPGVPSEVEERSGAPARVKRERKQRKGRGSNDRSAADLFGDSVKVSAADGFVEDGLAWDEMV